MNKKILMIVIGAFSWIFGAVMAAEVPEVPAPVCVPVHQDGIDIPCPGENSAPAENLADTETAETTSSTYNDALQSFNKFVGQGFEKLWEGLRQMFDGVANFLGNIKF